MKNTFFGIEIEKYFLCLFMAAYFIPNFYATDRIGNQWFYLSILSIIVFFYYSFDKYFLKNLKPIILNRRIFFYFLFILWSLISIFFSLNKIEGLVTFNQYFTVFFCYIFFQFLSYRIANGQKFIINLLLMLLIIETFLCGIPIISDIENNNLVFRSMKYSGAAANINITAFSLIYKVPILMYFFQNNTKIYKKILLASLLFFIIFFVSILGTRGAYLGLSVCIIIFIFQNLISKEKLFNKIRNLAWTFVPLIFAIFVNIKLTSNSNNIISRSSTISLSTKDGSVNQRLRYYNHALSQFIKTPLTGVGAGNWKLHSIDYDKNDINGFIVPYHAHNDFLQILAELGIFGLIFYLLFIYNSTKILFKSGLFYKHFNIFLIGSILVYLLDSLLNFPIARPISQLYLIAILTLISLHAKKPFV